MRIALIAHDDKKEDIIEWAKYNKDLLSKHELCATGTTGALIQKNTGLKVKKYASGPLGGDQQIGAKITEKKIDILIFFWDPLMAQPHDVDVKALLRVAVIYDVIVACNRKTADYVITSKLLK